MNRSDSKKGQNIVIKEGDRFRYKETGKVYVVRTVYRGEVLLQGEDGRGRRIANMRNLEVTCERLDPA